MHVGMYVCMYVCMYVFFFFQTRLEEECMYVCTYVRMCVYVTPSMCPRFVSLL